MKRLRWLPLLSLLLLASPAHADGIDVKVAGVWDFAFGWVDNADLKSRGRDDDAFGATQRIRTQINFIASEYLQAVLMFEIGDIDWGAPGRQGQGSGGSLDTDGVNVETKRAYLDWIIPDTEVAVRMGLQGVGLPMGNGWDNPVFSADVAGIVVSTPVTEMLEATVFWLRPFDRYRNDADGSIFNPSNRFDDEMDMFGLVLPVSGSDWSVTPWGMYAHIGNASGYYDYITGEEEVSFGVGDQSKHAHAWWVGLSTDVSIFDPLTFSLDAMYGRISRTELGVYDTDSGDKLGTMEAGTQGWFVVAALNYTLDWATPGIYGWYSSGDRANSVHDGKYGRLPMVGVDDGFAATSFGFPGSAGIGADTAISATGAGTWGVAIQLADMTFIEDLSHTLRFAYYGGTNDHKIIRNHGRTDDDILMLGAESLYLTDKDYAFEINFDHSYQIYENLTAILELGYINLDLDSNVWEDHKTDNAWKAQLLFQYEF